MKNKMVKTLSICVLLVLFGYTAQAVMVEKRMMALQSEMQPDNAAGNIRVTQSVTEVRVGKIGYITIQGQPGVRYTVTSSFKTDEGTRSVSQWRMADEKGMATFLWSVSTETLPGTYPVTITGGGSTLRLAHTVLP